MRLLALLLLAGCASQTTTLLEVELTGVVTAGAAEGDVEVQLHFAEQGVGELAHPLGEIERFEASLGVGFAHAFDYPPDDGTGLLVYAWHDADGDGVLCAPGVDDELAGLVEVEEFPAFAVEVELELDLACGGPEGLLP